MHRQGIYINCLHIYYSIHKNNICTQRKILSNFLTNVENSLGEQKTLYEKDLQMRNQEDKRAR